MKTLVLQSGNLRGMRLFGLFEETDFQVSLQDKTVLTLTIRY